MSEFDRNVEQHKFGEEERLHRHRSEFFEHFFKQFHG